MTLQLRWLVKRGAYHDSLRLLEIHAAARTLPGVVEAACVMATQRNLELVQANGLLPEGLAAGPEDLLIVLQGHDPIALESALPVVEGSLTTRQTRAEDGAVRDQPRSLDRAIKMLGGANVALISIPGAYAAAEAERALRRGLHVHLFSDNVALEDEVRLKRMAHEMGLLLMGPDCGTAILNGAPLGFANVVCRGPVGIVGASGTGIQQASVLLDRLGVGVSHAIGVGGRDLGEAVGGVMTLDALDALERDSATRAILLISKKPPASEVLRRIANRASVKPVVACFLGADPADLDAVEFGETIDDAVLKVARHVGEVDHNLDWGDFQPVVAAERARLAPTQTRVRGLYVGGSLAEEARLILAKVVDANVIDLGDDDFTVGRPHPMIDASLRAEWLVRAVVDPQTAVVLCDVILGFGAHADPAGALAAAVRHARSTAEHSFPVVVASVCGTPADPQRVDVQERTLKEAGVLVFPTNAVAARAAAAIAKR